MSRSLETTRMILLAAARVLGCGSAQLLIADEERQQLIITTGITNRDLPRLFAVENEMGFALEGARLPLAAQRSCLVRAYLEERLFVVHDVADLAGGFLPDDTLASVRRTIGPRSFAALPVIGRTGALGVLLFEKRDESGFTPEDRDLLVAYADRVGADLEAQTLSEDVMRLEHIEPSGPPQLYACDAQLQVVTGDQAGRALWAVLGVAEESLKEVLALIAARPVTVTVRAPGRHLRLTLSPGPMGTVLAAAEDLAAQERLRREAVRARDHLAKVLRSVDDVILTVDVEARIADGNEAADRLFGVPAAELCGREVATLCADRRSTARAEEMILALRSSGFAEAELRLRRPDGKVFPAEVSALLLVDEEGRPAGAMWRVHDVTERRRSEAERNRLRERLLLTERLSALGEMAARIAHEVRNPLVSIGAAAQLAAEELGESSPVKGELQAIVREVARLDNIVSDFLRFARPRQAELKPADLAPVVKESVAMVRAKVPEHKINVACAEPLIVRCDPDGIKQVLLNVLFNAVEAGGPAEVECEARQVGDQVELQVADRGAGVPPALRGRLFDPFFSTKTRGTGLGLVISKQIVDEHRGRIRLLNRRGGGTRVVIQLPMG
jgi:PAS domain S-box-containing protein